MRLVFQELPRLQADTFASRGARIGYRRRWHKLVHEAVMEWASAGGNPLSSIPTLEQAHITCTRYSAGKAPDADNLRYSFKAILDGLKESKVIVDDSPEHVRVFYHHEKAPPGKGYVVVEVVPG